jgi:hypothetical protein
MKAQTFKQYQLEHLIKDGVIIPASRLAEAKDLELKRSRDFEASIEDERRHRRTATLPSSDKLENLPLTRERFEERATTLFLDSSLDSYLYKSIASL